MTVAGELDAALTKCQRGLAARKAGCLAESLVWQEQAHQAAPGNWGIRVNLAVALQDVGRLDEAISHFAKAVAQSSAPIAKVNLAMAQLRAGSLSEGFGGFLSRWEVAEWPQQPYSVPFSHRLDASALEQPVVLLPDQGYGDTLLALPFMRWLLLRNPQATVVVKKPLVELVRAALGDVCGRIGDSAQGNFSGWLTGFDLPAVFPQALLDYAQQRAAIEKQLRQALAASATMAMDSAPRGLAVVWRGNPSHSLDGWRSVSPIVLAKSLAASDVTRPYVALLPDISETERAAFAQAGLSSLKTPEVFNFLDTARHLLHTPGLLTVDTAIAHLAGLLGTPTSLLLNAFGDWRWGHHAPDSIWYPSIKIFRQAVLGEWEAVVQVATLGTRAFPDLGSNRVSRHGKLPPDDKKN